MFPPGGRCLLGWGPDCPLDFVLPREDWALPAPPTVLEIGEVEEEEIIAKFVDGEKEFWRSRAKW